MGLVIPESFPGSALRGGTGHLPAAKLVEYSFVVPVASPVGVEYGHRLTPRRRLSESVVVPNDGV